MTTNQKLNIGKGFIITAVAVISIGITGCGGKKEGDAKTGTEAAAASASDAKPSDAKSWKYSEKVDKMSSETNYYASIDANEKLKFDFPYDGGSVANLTVRNKGKENEIILSVSKGQFNSKIENNTVRIKFDDEKPIEVPYTEPSSGSSDLIFIGTEKEVIAKLLTAKKVLIEAEFFNEGNRQMEFNVDGFKWGH
jgi:hypothetical protein